MPAIQDITSTAGFNAHLTSTSSSYTLIDFWATWCGPCLTIAPKFKELSHTWTNVHFLKVDVDHHQEIAARFQVKAMPTFVLVKNGQKVDAVVGANSKELDELLVRYAQSPSGQAPETVGNYKSVMDSFAIDKATCLNEHPQHTFRDLLKRNGNGGGYVVSDADEQLIMDIPATTNPVQVKAILVKAPRDHPEDAPTHVKVFVNRPGLNFDDAERDEAAHDVTLGDAATSDAGEVVELRPVRFKACESVQLFVVASAGGGGVTRLTSVQLLA